MTRAQLAYGHARIRARKSRLLPDDTLAALAGAEAPSLTVTGWSDLADGADGRAVVALVYARIVADYTLARAAYPAARPLLDALLGLHEIENVKLAWRAAVQQAAPARWRAAWRPLGPLESVSCDASGPATVRQLAAALMRTPYASAASAALAAHASDLASAELAFDRWASTRVLAAASSLPRRERAARELARAVIRTRDVALLDRALGAAGLAPDLAIGVTVLLGSELGAGAACRLPDLRGATHAALVGACARAFRKDVFGLGPPIAQVLLRERESRALISIAELRSRHASPADARRALAFDGGG